MSVTICLTILFMETKIGWQYCTHSISSIGLLSTTITYRVSHKQTGNRPFRPSVNIVR